MKLPEKATLTDQKYAEILALLERSGVNLAEVEETFTRGGGRGGQKINKTSNAVRLKHLPSGTTIKYQKYRELSLNRILALRELLLKLTLAGEKDPQAEKIRKQKGRRKRRSLLSRF